MGRTGRGDRGAEARAVADDRRAARVRAASLARYKLPKRLEIVAALPRNATGKILKYQLRQTFGKAGGAAAQQ